MIICRTAPDERHEVSIRQINPLASGDGMLPDRVPAGQANNPVYPVDPV
ncbi:MAG: hypothetical protein WBN77_12155 [Desulfobacterales bacterium]